VYEAAGVGRGAVCARSGVRRRGVVIGMAGRIEAGGAEFIFRQVDRGLLPPASCIQAPRWE